MKLLLLADIECKALWDYYKKEELEGVDLILSCGDLSAEYLSFIATMTQAPVLYVHGNHDTKYNRRGPDGCICIDDSIYQYKGLRILGLGGSMRYKQGDWQYTESQMRARVRKLRLSLWRNKGFDILLTHAPAQGLHDGEDLPHQGFGVFLNLLDKYEPSFFVHGHVHLNYGRNHIREDMYKDTRVINAFERYLIEVPEDKLGQCVKKHRHKMKAGQNIKQEIEKNLQINEVENKADKLAT